MGSLRRALGPAGPLRGRRRIAVAAAAVAAVVGVVLAVTAGTMLQVLGGALAIGALPAVLLWFIGDDVATLRGVAPAGPEATTIERGLARLDVLEQVLADVTRRPWDPTLRPWALATLPEKPVVLLPGADYHLPEIVELGEELQRRGREVVVACGRPHWDRMAEGLAAYPGLDLLAAPTEAQLVATASAVVTMKDWAGYGPLIVAANEAGIPTFAKVEGVQDYHDTDVGEELARRPYRTAGTILCQGRNDAENLTGATRIVGSTRLERLWWAPTTRAHEDLVVINLNFTYGVLAAERMTFLRSAVEACEQAGRRYVISLHPAEKARTVHPRAVSIGVSRLLERATMLVSRFSTAGFEAMARGVPFAYHNPHGERVGTFLQPDGAYDVTDSVASLAAVLAQNVEPGQHVRDRAAAHFGAQVDLDATRSSAVRAADVVLGEVIR
jgi:hypothetical protein